MYYSETQTILYIVYIIFQQYSSLFDQTTIYAKYANQIIFQGPLFPFLSDFSCVWTLKRSYHSDILL